MQRCLSSQLDVVADEPEGFVTPEVVLVRERRVRRVRPLRIRGLREPRGRTRGEASVELPVYLTISR